MSVLDRLAARVRAVDTRLAEAVAPVVEAKAATGPGAFAMTWHPMLSSWSRDPHRLMAEGQALFHTNMWVHAAEKVIGDKIKTTPWHLEDGDGETIDDSSPEEYRAVLRLLQRPSQELTWKRLVSITSRHLGLAGNAFWYLDQRDLLADTPLTIMYVNPCRMTPALDAAGNVTGWTLDHPDNPVVQSYSKTTPTPVPLAVEEVIHFTLDEPDTGIWGVGVAESAQRKLMLDRLTDSHTGQVLASGGRLSGMVTPKAQSAISDDQWVQFVRDWRSITSDPDAAKRLQVAKMPLDFHQMTATPKDLQLLDVSKQSREDILAGWQVPPSQIGIARPAGLNSGDSQGYDEAALSQGAVQPRGDAIGETVQIKLLDRWAALGITVRLVIEWPQFDDEAPLYTNAEKAKVVPLTIDQRLAQVGRDPLDPKLYGTLGSAIYMDQSMVPVFDPMLGAGSSGPAPASAPSSSTDQEEEVVAGKARGMGGLRRRTEVKWEPRIRRAVQSVLREQQAMAVAKVPHTIRKNDVSWWNEQRENKRMMSALGPLLEDMATEVAEGTRRRVKPPARKADSFITEVLRTLRDSAARRITAINQTTRDEIKRVIGEGVAAGEGPVDIAARLQEATAFNELRAETVARTETMLAYNESALSSYAQLDVEEVEAIDGDEDEECAERNGQTFSVAEALEITDHPNGTLDWVPVVKAGNEPHDVAGPSRATGQEVHIHLPEHLSTSLHVPTPEVTVNMPELKVPDVFVTVEPGEPPVVNVPAPVVNLPAPVVNVEAPAAKATTPQEVIVTQMPDRVHKAVRNPDGTIRGSIEVDG